MARLNCIQSVTLAAVAGAVFASGAVAADPKSMAGAVRASIAASHQYSAPAGNSYKWRQSEAASSERQASVDNPAASDGGYAWASADRDGVDSAKQKAVAAISTPAASATSTGYRWGIRSDADQSGYRWGIRSDADQTGYRWGIRSDANQSGYRWGIRSDADQTGYRWGIRSDADQTGYRWGIRSGADQTGYRWGIRSDAEQTGYRWGIRSNAEQTGYRWGIR